MCCVYYNRFFKSCKFWLLCGEIFLYIACFECYNFTEDEF